MIKTLLIFLFVTTLGIKVNAEEGEILYITDQLRLSLYESADQRSKILEYLSSGEKLEVSQNSGSYAFVETTTGKKGWVKRGFLVSQVPTVLLFKEEQEKTKALAKEIEKLANSRQIIDQYEEDMDALSQQLSTVSDTRDGLQAELAAIKLEAAEAQRKADLAIAVTENKAKPLDALITVSANYWRYLLPICLVLILFGYIIARRLLEARIKRKFQGVKVW